MSYKDLDIFNLALELFFKVHPLSLKLPKYELYELGSQIRRSADSVVTNIVEGYGRRKYKAEYIRFLVFSHASTDETILHILKIKQLYPQYAEEYNKLEKEYNILGAKINSYIKYVENNWK
ncbi:MAG: four helix bundle protein [Lentimicrobiaceae bacterium]|nr:four helix bundle protein [Lentimicrobiaceae bacterium]